MDKNNKGQSPDEICKARKNTEFKLREALKENIHQIKQPLDISEEYKVRRVCNPDLLGMNPFIDIEGPDRKPSEVGTEEWARKWDERAKSGFPYPYMDKGWEGKRHKEETAHITNIVIFLIVAVILLGVILLNPTISDLFSIFIGSVFMGLCVFSSSKD